MKINNIHIENFRCFESYDVSFGKKTTIFIGKNGAGKTNLITALKKGMSFIFAKSNEYQRPLNESNNCTVRAFNIWDTRFDQVQRTFSFPTKIEYKATFNNGELSWTFLKKKDPGSLHPTLYNEALNKVLSFYNSDIRNSNLPVLAFFSESYPHILNNVGAKAAGIVKMDKLPREFGYYGWDENTNCAELWQRRYIKAYNGTNDIKSDIERIIEQIDFLDIQIRNYEQNDKVDIDELHYRMKSLNDQLDEAKSRSIREEYERELSYINKRILSFTEPLRENLNFINPEFQVRGMFVDRPDRKSFSIGFSFNDGKYMYFEMLPQGYKRLFSIIFDIAYRSYILNEEKEPDGIVFIDEVELHLHPTLQQEVLGRLRKTFPQIQFIASTHSPLVISNLNADGVENKIIKLENEGFKYFNENVENVYGIDYTTNLNEVMESDYRPSTIDKLINLYLMLYGKQKQHEADEIYQKLKNYLGGEVPKLLQEEIDNKKKDYNI